MPNRYGGVGVTLPLNQIGTNQLTLQAGEVFYLPPGYWNISHGPSSSLQVLDPVMNVWRPVGYDGNGLFQQVDSDGNNYRVANQTGCPVAAVLTNAGSGYTSAPTITPSAGSSKWQAIMGYVVSTTAIVTTGGSNYIYPPAVIIQPPGNGIPATATAQIAGGVVTGITITNQGAGYTAPPVVSFMNDPRDNTGSGAQVTLQLTGFQTVTGVICTDHGIPITNGTAPTLTFSGGGGANAAASVIMDWTVTSYSVTSGGAGYTGAVLVETLGSGAPTVASAYTNPYSQASFFRAEPALIQGALNAGAVTATGQNLIRGGHLAGTANGQQVGVFGTTATTAAALTVNVGGVSDYLWMQAG